MTSAATTLPTEYSLSQNFPNPFNPSTTISFRLPQAADWNLTVYNITGGLVRSYSGSSAAGNVDVIWDGRTDDGSETASGIYLYRLDAGSFSQVRKMVLLK
jgi:flagellar hook assembly protein FlgD